MTPEQRYVFDATGYLHLRKVISGDELQEAQDAADRYINTPHDDIPRGISLHAHTGFPPSQSRVCIRQGVRTTADA